MRTEPERESPLVPPAVLVHKYCPVQGSSVQIGPGLGIGLGLDSSIPGRHQQQKRVGLEMHQENLQSEIRRLAQHTATNHVIPL